MNIIPNPKYTITKYKRELYNWVKPTHFITLSLSKTRFISGVGGTTTMVSGDEVIYDHAYCGLIRSLSKAMAGERAWRRNRVSIPNLGCLEGGANRTEPHLHACLRKPSSLSNEEFHQAIRHAALGNPWIKDSRYAVVILDTPEPSDGKATVWYSLKEGLDRVFIA